MSIILIFIAVVIFIMGIFALREGYDKLLEYHLIHDTPTSKIRSLAMGLVEIKGNPYNPEFIKTPYSWSDCVYYNFKTYEYKNDDPNSAFAVNYWEKISEGEDETSFYANDGTGYVYIEPKDAEHDVRLKKVLYTPRVGREAKLTLFNRLKRWLFGSYKSFEMTETGFYEFQPDEIIPFKIRVGDRKIHEYYIGPEDDIYCMGTAMHDETAHNMIVIDKGESEPMFILTNRSEEELLMEKKEVAHGAYSASAFLMFFSVVVFIISFIIA